MHAVSVSIHGFVKSEADAWFSVCCREMDDEVSADLGDEVRSSETWLTICYITLYCNIMRYEQQEILLQ